jgi:hypothetical protein
VGLVGVSVMVVALMLVLLVVAGRSRRVGFSGLVASSWGDPAWVGRVRLRIRNVALLLPGWVSVAVLWSCSARVLLEVRCP